MKTFEEYWKENGVRLPNMGAMEQAFKEVAEKAWNARDSVPQAWKCTVGNETFTTFDRETAEGWEKDGFEISPVT